MALAFGLLGHEGQGRGRQAVDLLLGGQQLTEGLGGVEDVVAEVGAQLGELLCDLVEALLGLHGARGDGTRGTVALVLLAAGVDTTSGLQ